MGMMYGFRGPSDDPPGEPDEFCQICGKNPDECVCPECTVCSEYGNPECIDKHMPRSAWSVILTKEQLAALWDDGPDPEIPEFNPDEMAELASDLEHMREEDEGGDPEIDL